MHFLAPRLPYPSARNRAEINARDRTHVKVGSRVALAGAVLHQACPRQVEGV